MKHILRLLSFAAAVVFFAACDKTGDLPLNQNGTTPILSASTVSVAPAPADSNNTALTLNWSAPKYANDSTTTRFVVQIDSAGKNFAKGYTKVVTDSLSTSFTAKELNTFLLGRGYPFNVPVDVDVRVLSSYSNNNEQLSSNTLRIKMTPYKVPPKVALPTSGKLFLVGSATQGGWTNPVPAPSQEFARLDETTFGGVFQLNGGQEYLILPVNGDWGNKYSVGDKSTAGLNLGGDFGFNLNDNIPGPATSGLYKIMLDFQTGKFSVTPYSGNLPDNLFIVGDATNGGWNNPVPVPSQQFDRINSSVFEIIVPLIGGKQYLFLPVNGDWGHKFAVADNSITGLAAGGAFGYDLSSNFPAPAADGTYKIVANFITATFSVTKQ